MRRMLACTLVVAALALGATPLRAATGDGAASAALAKFYQWYLRQPHHEWTANLAQVKPLFDPGLYASLVTVLHSKANQREPIMDFDPFVNAQSDAQAYVLGAATTSGADVRVPVTLTLSGGTGEKTHLTAVMRKDANGTFVIYNFVYGSTDDLRDFLAKQPKD